MGGKRQIFHAEEFQIIYIDALPSRRHELYLVTSFQRGQYAKGKRVSLQQRNRQTLSSQVTKININSDTSCYQHVPLIGCDENGTLPLGSSSQNTRSLI